MYQQATISGLVREAVRDRYLPDREERMAAMQAFVGARELREHRMQ